MLLALAFVPPDNVRGNQFEAAQSGVHQTNKVSKGWHNRFHTVVGKNHSDIYALLKEFQKEQADSETFVAELSRQNCKSCTKEKMVRCTSQDPLHLWSI